MRTTQEYREYFKEDETEYRQKEPLSASWFGSLMHMLVSVAGVIYGIIWVIGAVGLYKNRMWGLVLSCINCIITLALMIFMLPAGIADGILAGTALILMLKGYFGDKTIGE